MMLKRCGLAEHKRVWDPIYFVTCFGGLVLVHGDTQPSDLHRRQVTQRKCISCLLQAKLVDRPYENYILTARMENSDTVALGVRRAQVVHITLQ